MDIEARDYEDLMLHDQKVGCWEKMEVDLRKDK